MDFTGPGMPLMNPMLAGGGMPLRGIQTDCMDFSMPGNPNYMFDGRPIGPMSFCGTGRMPGMGTGMSPLGGGLGGFGGLGRSMMPGRLGMGMGGLGGLGSMGGMGGMIGMGGMGMGSPLMGGMGMLGGAGGLGLERFGIGATWFDMLDDDEWDDMDDFEDPDQYLVEIRRAYRRREKVMRRLGKQQFL
ncbi:hypothetical protein LTR78_009728 [Recurvomyces mirabilis]|uniref:Uncharacterized protein n=1 Tax=Recurvomyces mirabilis TaxID=574656 RepID=A0AAE0WID1_9PEZI|nr:hypothetical protein LTR78_009728 [Recurvomyces mirabilis]KAK5156351.1 hypothetical protein LTS14_005239 [Recurvomyces mirabilis]